MKRYRLRDLSHDLRLEKSFNLALFSSQMVAVVPRNDRLKVSKYVYCVHSTQYVYCVHRPPRDNEEEEEEEEEENPAVTDNPPPVIAPRK